MSSGLFGKNWKINRKADATYYALGGTVLDATLDPRITLAEEAGSGEGRQLTSHKVVAAKPVIDWTMNVKKLDDFITTYAMITAEGAVPAHELYVTDGHEYHDLTNCKVNTCRITIRQLESIKAAISDVIKDHAAGTSWAFEKTTEKSMFKDAVSTLTIGGSPVTKWSEVEFGVDNRVLQEILGTAIKPTEVEEQEVLYSGYILRARKSGADSLIADALAGTPKTVVIALTDNQTVPVTKTFTFTDALLKTSRIRDRALGLIMERIEWQGDKYILT